MTFFACPNSQISKFVADTSVLINLEASRQAQRIIECTVGTLQVTDGVYEELKRGEQCGYSTAKTVDALCQQGCAEIVSLNERGQEIYRSLVEGPAVSTLGDGEASTIAYAISALGSAVLDETKARKICATKYSTLNILSTLDLMLSDPVSENLGSDLSQAIGLAVKNARMQVPKSFSEAVQEHLSRFTNMNVSEEVRFALSP